MDALSTAAIRRARAALSVACPDGPDRDALARDYIRGIIARTIGGSTADTPADYAAARWGHDSNAARLVKAGVANTQTDDAQVAGHSPRDAFFSRVLEASIVGQLANARRVGFDVRTLTPGTGSTGYWVGESRPVPVSRYVLDGDSLPSRKVAGLVVLTKEALADPQSEARVTEDVLRACTGVLDQAFVGDQAGTDSTPTGILQGISATASSGNAATDAATAIEAFDGDLSTAAWITDPTTAAMMALHGATAFQNVGANGGRALGIPLIASRSSPRDSTGGQLVLVDQAAIAWATDGFELKQSTASMIEADSDPQADAEAPTAGTATRIALFQNELVALMAVIHANWKRARTGAVAAISSADYGVS